MTWTIIKAFLGKNWLILGATILALGLAAYVGHQINSAIEDARTAERGLVELEQKAVEAAALRKTLNTKRRQDEIRSIPRTDARTIERLRERSF